MPVQYHPPALGEVRISGITPTEMAARVPASRGLLLGVAGGIGCGKTTVTRVLADLGAVVADADKIGHSLLDVRTETGQEILARFGPRVLEDGQISRPHLAAAVFGDASAVADLNAITHPRIRARAWEILNQVQPGEVGVYDAALIIEAGMEDLVDVLVVVTAPEAQRLELLQRNRGISAEQARARIAHQMTETERVGHADVVIYNYGSLPKLQCALIQWAEDVYAALRA